LEKMLGMILLGDLEFTPLLQCKRDHHKQFHQKRLILKSRSAKLWRLWLTLVNPLVH